MKKLKAAYRDLARARIVELLIGSGFIVLLLVLSLGFTYVVVWVAAKAIQAAGGLCP